jgi:hypothetical protein
VTCLAVGGFGFTALFLTFGSAVLDWAAGEEDADYIKIDSPSSLVR